MGHRNGAAKRLQGGLTCLSRKNYFAKADNVKILIPYEFQQNNFKHIAFEIVRTCPKQRDKKIRKAGDLKDYSSSRDLPKIEEKKLFLKIIFSLQFWEAEKGGLLRSLIPRVINPYVAYIVRVSSKLQSRSRFSKK